MATPSARQPATKITRHSLVMEEVGEMEDDLLDPGRSGNLSVSPIISNLYSLIQGIYKVFSLKGI